MAFPPDTTYALLSEFKQRASAEAAANTVTDGIGQQLLNDAAYMVDSLTRGAKQGYEAFSVSSSEIRYFDDDLSINGSIPIDDAVTVTALVRGGTTITSDFYKTYPYNPGNGPITHIYLRGDIAAPTQLTIYANSWYGFPYRKVGLGQMAVTGTWGYCTGTTTTRPPIVKEATLQIALLMYKQNNVSMSDVLQMLTRNPTAFLTSSVNDRLQALRREKAVAFG